MIASPPVTAVCACLSRPLCVCPQVLLCVEALRASVPAPLSRLPATLTVFLAQATHVMLRPGHPMYNTLNKVTRRMCVCVFVRVADCVCVIECD